MRLSLPSVSGQGGLQMKRQGNGYELYPLRLLLCCSKVAICDLRARDLIFLLAKRGDNRANDGGVLKLGDREALLAGVLQ